MLPAENTANSNNYYKAIFDNSLSAIFFTIPNGTILDVNKAACDIFGYTTDEFKKIGRFGLFDLADPNLILFLETRDRDGAAKGDVSRQAAIQYHSALDSEVQRWVRCARTGNTGNVVGEARRIKGG